MGINAHHEMPRRFSGDIRHIRHTHSKTGYAVSVTFSAGALEGQPEQLSRSLSLAQYLINLYFWRVSGRCE